jgi:anti-sigma regulatory factor (Ser/Thr protein kinase)
VTPEAARGPAGDDVLVVAASPAGYDVATLCDAYVAARGAGDRPRYALRLVIEELLTNVAKYAGARGSVEVRVRAGADGISVRIEDDGVAFDPTAAVAPAAPTTIEAARVGGLGLKLVRASVRRMTYRRERGRNVVECEIPLDDAAHDARKRDEPPAA